MEPAAATGPVAREVPEVRAATATSCPARIAAGRDSSINFSRNRSPVPGIMLLSQIRWKTNVRKLLLGAFVGTTIAIAIAWLYCVRNFMVFMENPSPDGVMEFAPGVWSDPLQKDLRWEMVNDLRANHLMNRMHQTRVREILGTADQTVPASQIRGAKAEEALYLYYDLGHRGIQFDSCYLVLVFDINSFLVKSFVFSN